MPVMVYQCEFCDKLFEKWDECREHERSHAFPKMVYTYEDYREEIKPYPYFITLEMNDGAIVGYVFSTIVSNPQSQGRD